MSLWHQVVLKNLELSFLINSNLIQLNCMFITVYSGCIRSTGKKETVIHLEFFLYRALDVSIKLVCSLLGA